MVLEQLYTFGTVDRDPRERVVSVAYFALVKLSDYRAKAATDAAKAEWFPIPGNGSTAAVFTADVFSATALLTAQWHNTYF